MARAPLTSAEDMELRENAFAFLRLLQSRTGGPIRHADVADFRYQGERMPLMDRQRGIRKPAALEAALSFRTVHAKSPAQRPYDDRPGAEGFLRYKWRGDDPSHAENRALRAAQVRDLPLIWFQGIEQGIYLPVFPVWLVAEEPARQQFVVALDHMQHEQWHGGAPEEVKRRYSEVVTRTRLHQPVFRERVITAYEGRCSVCRFRHRSLLDAAHIRADAEGGEPIVTNGLCLCRIHHGAYDENIIGIDPHYTIIVRPDVLAEVDGPTLEHSIKAMHGAKLTLPTRRASRPDSELLAERFATFAASI